MQFRDEDLTRPVGHNSAIPILYVNESDRCYRRHIVGHDHSYPFWITSHFHLS